MRNYWNLKLSKLWSPYSTPDYANHRLKILPLLVAGCSMFWWTGAYAQLSKPEPERAESQYIFPIRPGTPASLSGTMGELRSTHFHTGLDIRTNNEIGWPVVAAQSGYISRGGVSSAGYGNVLYVKHPDGNTTVYGHLDKFSDAVGNYILKERYRRKTSNIDLYFREGQFPIAKRGTRLPCRKLRFIGRCTFAFRHPTRVTLRYPELRIQRDSR